MYWRNQNAIENCEKIRIMLQLNSSSCMRPQLCEIIIKREKSATACALRWFCAESINHLLRVYTELPLGDAINWLSQAKIDWFACSRAIKINFSKREVESLSSTCDCFSYFYSTLRPVLVAAAAAPLFVPCARALLHSCVNSRAWFSPINIANWSALSLSHRLTIKLRPSVKILFSCHAFLLVSFAPACPLLQVFRGGGEKRNNRKKWSWKIQFFFLYFFLLQSPHAMVHKFYEWQSKLRALKFNNFAVPHDWWWINAV